MVDSRGDAVSDAAGKVSALFLMLGGVLSLAPVVAVYQRLSAREPGFAMWAFAVGLVSAGGAAIHGGHDLAIVLNPPAGQVPDLPNELDPRGLLTFGAAGLSLIAIGWLIAAGRELPQRLGYVAIALGADLVVLYIARLTVLDSKHAAIMIPAVLAGFALNPAWYLWLARELWRG